MKISSKFTYEILGRPEALVNFIKQFVCEWLEFGSQLNMLLKLGMIIKQVKLEPDFTSSSLACLRL